ncbi:AAI domain-containing protein [Heracleum sosnowskyi]|uniref:AAI domain-containing protein n=1 Tax=Heracleum sosnowskyi TaxID=360622 RepID=A0AAD8GXT6_9APIA|nr:AAI domain-containing protein [Heracleum sosnowskyi]
MASKQYITVALTILVLIQFVGFGSADISKDINQCESQLIVLEPCLTYVQGGAKTPTLDCCAGVKQVLQKSKVCLCILVKDRDHPEIGFKFNATLALGLPARCNAPSSVNECPALLHLTAGSPEAKIFEDFANGSISTPTGKENGTSDGSSSAAIKSDGGVQNKRLGIEMGFGLVIFVFLLISPFTV